MLETNSHNDSICSDPIVYSVVVPVYNSDLVLMRLYRRLVAVMESLGKRFELIFVDDDSTDASWSILAEIARNDLRVIAIQLARNMGQSEATLVGLRMSAGEIIITIDDDLQYLPEEILKLLARLDSSGDYDAIFGVPLARRHSAWRRLASGATNILFSPVLRKPVSLHFSGFCAIRRPIVQRLVALRWPDPFLSALLLQITRRIGVVRVAHSDSELRSSRYSIRKLARVPFGFFGGMTDRDRYNFILGASGTGMSLLALAYAAFHFGQTGLMINIFVTVAATLGAPILAFGLAVAAAEWRVLALRRKPLVTIGVRSIITAGRETADLDDVAVVKLP